MVFTWDLHFLERNPPATARYALIILNQPFSFALLRKLWDASAWRCCADGGANRLLDTVTAESISRSQDANLQAQYLPDLVKGDLDSLRDNVKQYYESQNVQVVHDPDQYSTDLMKCLEALSEKEQREETKYDVVILGGLEGRLDQTIHTLSLLHKLRKVREHVFCVNDLNVVWVLDEGEHHIHVNHTYLGQTCGILPVGIDAAKLTTKGLQWNLTDADTSLSGMVSTSNHLLPEEPVVYIKVSNPVVWTVEVRVNKL